MSRLVTALFFSIAAFGATPAQALLWPSEVLRIERDLGAAEVAVRRRAAARISELGERVAARVAARAIEDPDVEVRLSAIAAVRALRLSGFSERVSAWLTDPDARLRLEAIELLASSVGQRSRNVSSLARALSDAEPAVRAAAASALGRSGSSEAVGGLLGRLDDSTVEVKTSVVRALSRLGDPRAVVPLISKTEDPRPEVRRAVARALGEIGDPRASSALVLLLRDSDESVRVAAVGALGALGIPAAAPSLSSLLGPEASTPVRRAAIDALSMIGGAEAVTALVRQLGVHAEDRDAIVAALARTGTSAVPALNQCVLSEATAERLDGCTLALARVAGHQAGPTLRDVVRRRRVSASAALTALAETGHSDALLLVLEHLGHAEVGVQKAALAAAAKLLDPRRPDGRAVEPLQRAFEAAQGRRADRVEILRLLGRTGSPRALGLLGSVADRGGDLELRVAALTALGSVEADGARPVLLRALSDREPAIRFAAALSLRNNGAASGAAELLERLERAASQDRLAVALALGGAFVRVESPALIRRLAQAIVKSRDGERDALIEALGRAPAALAGTELDRLASSADGGVRKKVAEVARAGGRPRLLRLARDPEAAVRADALWALGAAGGAAERALLERAFGDLDVTAAANAVSAYGRIGQRTRADVAAALCRVLDDRRPAVRSSGLLSLRHAGARCADSRERRLVVDDPAASVRRAAAMLLRDVQTSPEDERALRRCATEESDGATAVACSAPRQSTRAGDGRALVFVVPVGEAAATARAPFALVRPDGLVRHGVADRRGAVYETDLPDGALELAVPAAFDD